MKKNQMQGFTTSTLVLSALQPSNVYAIENMRIMQQQRKYDATVHKKLQHKRLAFVVDNRGLLLQLFLRLPALIMILFGFNSQI
jgi:hypothetical protein